MPEDKKPGIVPVPRSSFDVTDTKVTEVEAPAPKKRPPVKPRVADALNLPPRETFEREMGGAGEEPWASGPPPGVPTTQPKVEVEALSIPEWLPEAHLVLAIQAADRKGTPAAWARILATDAGQLARDAMEATKLLGCWSHLEVRHVLRGLARTGKIQHERTARGAWLYAARSVIALAFLADFDALLKQLIEAADANTRTF